MSFNQGICELLPNRPGMFTIQRHISLDSNCLGCTLLNPEKQTRFPGKDCTLTIFENLDDDQVLLRETSIQVDAPHELQGKYGGYLVTLGLLPPGGKTPFLGYSLDMRSSTQRSLSWGGPHWSPFRGPSNPPSPHLSL